MTDDPTTTARLDTTDPDRPRGDVRLGDARLSELAEALAGHRLTTPVQCSCGWRETDPGAGTHEHHVSEALGPVVAGWIAEERAGAGRCPECGHGTRDGRLACGPDCGGGTA